MACGAPFAGLFHFLYALVYSLILLNKSSISYKDSLSPLLFMLPLAFIDH